jgi:putative FmdB family regulatory protein
MPIYEYKCRKCGSLIEVLQKVHAAPLKICSHCGGELKKQVSIPAIQFKGSGWYITDYAQKGTNHTAAPEKNSKKEEKPKGKEKPDKAKKDVPSSPAN